MYDEDFDDVGPEKKNKKSNHHKKILDALEELEDYDTSNYDTSSYTSKSQSILPSSIMNEKQPSKEEIRNKRSEQYDPDDWFESLMEFNPRKPRGNKSVDLFGEIGLGKKKKKKKKKEKGELTDYNKEFEPEIAFYRNLLHDQNRFTESLQREYDNIKSAKSSARGVNKTMSDLIENINDARTLSMQLVEKHVNTKKTIAELQMKEKKENGANALDGDNMSDFASTYLKQMISERKNFAPDADVNIADFDDDNITDVLNTNLSDMTRSSDVESYLKHEHDNVTIYAYVNPEDADDYEFVAKDVEGNNVPDYPLPIHTSLSINRSTDLATDIYGQKYTIIWK